MGSSQGCSPPAVGPGSGSRTGRGAAAGFARFGDSGGEGVVLPAGRQTRVGVWAGGSYVTSFTVPALAEGTEALVFAAGLLSEPARADDGFALLAATEAGGVGFLRQDPVVYVLHASPDAPAVDVYAGENELVDDFAFGELAGPLQVPPAAYELDAYAHASGSGRPSGAPAVTVSTPALEAGNRYLAIATGFLGDGSFTLLPVVEGWDGSDPSLAPVGVVPASPDAPAVDIGTVDRGVLTPVVSDLAYGGASDPAGLRLPAGTWPLGIAVAGLSSPLLSFDVTVAPGQNVWAVAVGSLGGTGESFRVLAVDTTPATWGTATLWP